MTFAKLNFLEDLDVVNIDKMVAKLNFLDGD